MNENTLVTTLGTLAQVSAALAALIGFLGLWKRDWLEREADQIEPQLAEWVARERDSRMDLLYALQPTSRNIDIAILRRDRLVWQAKELVKKKKQFPQWEHDVQGHWMEAATDRLGALPREIQWLNRALAGFLLLALAVLAMAITGMVYSPYFSESAQVSRAIVATSILMFIGTTYMVFEAAGWLRKYRKGVLMAVGIGVGILAVWVSLVFG